MPASTGIALLVIAKAPLPGRVKTRLCPPCTPAQAAALAQAALLDTLEVVARTPAARRVLVFDGGEVANLEDFECARARWCPPGFELIAQRGGGLAERLAAAFEDVGQAALLVGMDTPQVTAELLLEGVAALSRPEVDAVLGPALDGGYWSVGLKRPTREVFTNVPMSEPFTCAAQRMRIRQLGLRLHEQLPLLDFDTIDSAREVARQAPGTRFAAALAVVDGALGAAGALAGAGALGTLGGAGELAA
ncbi:MAG: DUF2064 domain-containing protein [Solirubrobacteraceae bacterium]